jgi:hypothetical protein
MGQHLRRGSAEVLRIGEDYQGCSLFLYFKGFKDKLEREHKWKMIIFKRFRRCSKMLQLMYNGKREQLYCYACC